jgi:hypothetical protein
MGALSGVGPPPRKAAAPTEAIGQGRRRSAASEDDEIAEAEPDGKARRIDPLAAILWHRLGPAARARARRVNLRPGDPLGALLANRHTVCIVDVLALRDHARRRPQGARP